MKHTLSLIIFALSALVATPSFAQYNSTAGTSAPRQSKVIETRDAETGKVERRVVDVKPTADKFGNVAGKDYDLAVDGAFEGQTIAVLHLYAGSVYEKFDFKDPKAALEQKGFGVYRWVGHAPSPEELRKKLKKACQLWVIADQTRHLNDEHIAVIKEFFESGRGLYIWGDNDPYYTDANAIGQAIFGSTMSGNLWGDKVVNLKTTRSKSGIVQDHLLSTGLENIYEGITIATIHPANDDLKPLIWGSEGNLVATYYDKGGNRAIFDGGFTRLYNKWDTAGTGRYVKNAAAWLTNYERFGDDVVGAAHRSPAPKRAPKKKHVSK